jgi:hypothetical protein
LGILKPFIDSPPTLKLSETNEGAQQLLENPLLEILGVRPKATANDDSVRAILKKIASSSGSSKSSKPIYGKTTNMDPTEIIVLRGFADQAVRSWVDSPQKN